MMELFRGNSKWLKAVNYYLKKKKKKKKNSIIDIWRGFKYTSATAYLEHRSRASMTACFLTAPEEYPRHLEIFNIKHLVNGF